MPEKRREVWRGWNRGWNPRNRPSGVTGYLWPYDLADGELLDARGVEFTRGGVAKLMRNQLMIHPPQEDIADTSIGVAKTLLEYRTDDDNQLLAFCRYDSGGTATDVGRLYKLATDWDALAASSPTEWGYGHEIFGGQTWSYVSTSVTLRWWGVADAAQFDDILFITQYNVSGHDAPMFWDGTALREVGIDAPTTEATATEDTGDTDTDYPAGRYTYYYTYYDAATGQESMPAGIASAETVEGGTGIPRYVSAVASSVTIAADNGIDVANIEDHPSEAYSKKLYRAYTENTEVGVRGQNFYYIATIADGTITYEDDDIPPYAVGETIAYDHAKPPRGVVVESHKDRLYMAGLSDGSPSYEDYNTGAWGNILWFSALQDPFSWPADNAIEIGDDTDITNVVSWRDYLFITKEGSCWVLEGAGESDYQLRQISDSIGCIAQNAIASSPHGVLFASSGAWYLWNGSGLKEILPMEEDSPWSQWASDATVQTVCYHDGHFYIMQEGYMLMWEVASDRWKYFTVSLKDQDGYQAGIRAYALSSKQAHVLTRMQWYGVVWPADGADSDEHRYITVLHPTFDFDDTDSDGTSGPSAEYHANVSMRMPPLIAPPGMVIRPTRLWVHGSWDTTGASLQPKLYVYDTSGNNAFATAPNAPQGGNVIGIPSGVHFGDETGYGAASNAYRSNIDSMWYVEISGTKSPNFELDAVEIEYILMPTRGA